MEGSSVDATNTIPTHCRAVVYKSYFEGTGAEDKVSSVLSMDEKFPVETLDAGMLLVRVKACSVNPVDWKTIAGVFGRYIPSAIGGPRFSSDGTVPVADGSGVVVRSRCPDFKPGDEVVWDNAARFGSLREFSTVRGVECTLKPKNLSFVETTANVGLASGTAVAGVDYLINYLKKPEKLTVLVLGGAGGVGAAAIKYLKALGHTVYTTASSRNVEFCTTLGADAVIDYTTSKWVDALPGKIDAIFQCVGSAQDLEWAEKALPQGCFVSCDSGKSGLMSNVVSAIGTKISKPFHYNLFLNKACSKNLRRAVALLEEGKWTPTPPCEVLKFENFAHAFDLSRSGKATGKIVIEL